MPNHGKGGRPRKPDEVKALQGTLRKDRTTSGQPKFTGTPKCPQWLQGRARAEWKRVAPQLRALGMLTEADLALFVAYCQAFGEYVDLTVALGNLEATHYETPKGALMARPEVKQRRDAYIQMRECAREFGFSPASRSTIRVLTGVDTPDQGTPEQDAGRSIQLLK